MLPDASLHRPDPGYFRRLLNQAGFTYADAATCLGRSERTIARYAARGGFDYATQYALEVYAVGLGRLAKKDDILS